MMYSKLKQIVIALLFISAFTSCDLLDDKSSANDILAFSFPIQSASLEIIDVDAHTVRITVPAGTDLTALVPTIIISEEATVSPQSGVANDFTNTAEYTVTAEDGSRALYLVMVTREGSGGETGGEDGEDTEFLIYVFGKDSWTPFAGKTGVTFTNSNNDVLTITDNGTKVEFTGKAVGESTITAKFENQTLKAVVKVRATEVVEGKKYITYKQPVTAYYMEYTEAGKIYAKAYENKERADVAYYNDSDGEYYTIQYRQPNGLWLSYSSLYPNTWLKQNSLDGFGSDAEDWVDKWSVLEEYPMGYFAAWVSTWGDDGYTYFNREADIKYVVEKGGVLPDNTEVTQFYVRNEKFINIDCAVFQENHAGKINTFWVDLSTGFTLKYSVTTGADEKTIFEVSSFKVGKPDWDEKHLHPITCDDIE